MKVKVTVDFNTDEILKKRGLGASNDLRNHVASEVARLSDPYVPMQQGDLKNRKTIAADGSQIVYEQPYAHYQFYGKVMAGRAPKSYNGEDLTYHGAMRGARWTERMLADKSKELTESVENFIAQRG